LTVSIRGSTIRRWWPPVLWIGVIFSLSTIPGPTLKKVGFSVPDKLAHVVEYAILGALSCRARPGMRPSFVEQAGPVLLLAALVGLADELYQRLIPGRESSGLDWVADLVGATLGSWIVWVIGVHSLRSSSRREER
jgi:VanZ family protein